MTSDVVGSIEDRLHAALNEVAESVTCSHHSAMSPDEYGSRRRIRGARAVISAGIAVVIAIGVAIAVTTATSTRDSPRHRPASGATSTPRQERTPRSIDSISIDSISLRAQVGEGLEPATLSLGPAHDATSGLPGSGRTIVIVGHRTTHTKPFLRLNEMASGAVIVLTNHGGEQFRYVVVAKVVVNPADVAPTERRYDGDLVLVTNTPRFTARQRLLVIARPSG